MSQDRTAIEYLNQIKSKQPDNVKVKILTEFRSYARSYISGRLQDIADANYYLALIYAGQYPEISNTQYYQIPNYFVIETHISKALGSYPKNAKYLCLSVRYYAKRLAVLTKKGEKKSITNALDGLHRLAVLPEYHSLLDQIAAFFIDPAFVDNMHITEEEKCSLWLTLCDYYQDKGEIKNVIICLKYAKNYFPLKAEALEKFAKFLHMRVIFLKLDSQLNETLLYDLEQLCKLPDFEALMLKSSNTDIGNIYQELILFLYVKKYMLSCDIEEMLHFYSKIKGLSLSSTNSKYVKEIKDKFIVEHIEKIYIFAIKRAPQREKNHIALAQYYCHRLSECPLEEWPLITEKLAQQLEAIRSLQSQPYSMVIIKAVFDNNIAHVPRVVIDDKASICLKLAEYYRCRNTPIYHDACLVLEIASQHLMPKHVNEFMRVCINLYYYSSGSFKETQFNYIKRNCIDMIKKVTDPFVIAEISLNTNFTEQGLSVAYAEVAARCLGKAYADANRLRNHAICKKVKQQLKLLQEKYPESRIIQTKYADISSLGFFASAYTNTNQPITNKKVLNQDNKQNERRHPPTRRRK